MLSFLPAPVVGALSATLLLLNLVVISLFIILFAGLEKLCLVPALKRRIKGITHDKLPLLWVTINDFIMGLTTKTQWDIQGQGELNPKSWYFMTSNHQTWLDILVLESAFRGKVPFMKFFMKRSLLWKLPVGGLACYVSGFPFMARYSKSYLKKHPEKKGRDLEITKKSCEKFKTRPSTIMNFIESTRSTPEKRQRQNSPYQYLLKPKAGGMAYVLEAMNHCLKEFINVTIVYPDSDISFWKFLCGQVDKIIVRYEVMPVPDELAQGYMHDPKARVRFQKWLNQLWEAKDKQIQALQAGKALDQMAYETSIRSQ